MRKSGVAGLGRQPVTFDPYRAIVFPNNLRQLRRERGFSKLLALSGRIQEIPYIRLSKIERGEVVARADELRRIGAELGVDPASLLIDVRDGAFDIAAWASDLIDVAVLDKEEEEFAVLLGAALRRRRTTDASLSIAALDSEYGLPPVILSRIENAHKTIDRWNDHTVKSLCRLFGVGDLAALRAAVTAAYERGELDDYLGGVDNAGDREAKTAARIAELAAELTGGAHAPKTPAAKPAPAKPAETAGGGTSGSFSGTLRTVDVFGAPLPDGLVARTPTGERVEVPSVAGPRAWGMKICRPTLGIGLPARATVIVDPDRFPAPGDLAVIEDGQGYRLLMVTTDRRGALMGYSENPEREIRVDALDPSQISGVIGAVFQ